MLPTGEALEQLITAALKADGELTTANLGVKCGAWSGNVRKSLHSLLRAGRVTFRYEGDHTLWRLVKGGER